jgi:hypothetical protein
MRQRKRGAGERWPKSFSGCPLTTGCRTGILYPEPQRSLADQRVPFRGLQASVSPTPCVADFGAASANGPQSCAFADLHIATSPGGREVFDGLRSALLRGEVTSSSWRRPCALQAPSSSRRSSPSLLSSPYCPPSQSLGCRSAPTRIVGTVFSITTAQRKKTSSALRKRVRSAGAHRLAATTRFLVR